MTRLPAPDEDNATNVPLPYVTPRQSLSAALSRIVQSVPVGGATEGIVDGTVEGIDDGINEGIDEGTEDGIDDGTEEGSEDGIND